MKRAATPARPAGPPSEDAIPRLAETLAHKLRNPLGSIQACADVLARSLALEGEEAALLEAVRTDARRLKYMIDDFAMLAGAPRVREGAVLLGDALRDALALAPIADPVHRDVDLRVEVPEGLPPLAADRDALTHALYTVVLNAFEAVERSGVVTIRAGLEDRGCVLEVVDTGPGFAEDAPARLWNPFYSTKRARPGLGLYAARRLIEAMGGSVDAPPSSEGGATVRLRLRLAPPGAV